MHTRKEMYIRYKSLVTLVKIHDQAWCQIQYSMPLSNLVTLASTVIWQPSLTWELLGRRENACTDLLNLKLEPIRFLVGHQIGNKSIFPIQGCHLLAERISISKTWKFKMSKLKISLIKKSKRFISSSKCECQPPPGSAKFVDTSIENVRLAALYATSRVHILSRVRSTLGGGIWLSANLEAGYPNE